MTQPAPQHQHPAPPAQYAPHASMQPAPAGRPRRAFAIAALVAAGVKLLATPAQAFALVAVLGSGGAPSAIGAVSMVIGVVSLVLALVAIGLAIVSLVRREQARLLAGIAIGIAIATLVALVTSLLQGAALAVI